MKKTLICLLLICVTEARADGCFVDFLNPSQCSSFVSAISCTGITSLDTSKYGAPVGELCRRLENQSDSIQLLQSQRDQNLAGWNQCLDIAASIETNRQQWIDYADYVEGQWNACGDTTKQIHGAIGYWEGLTHYYESREQQWATYAAFLKSKCGKKCRNL